MRQPAQALDITVLAAYFYSKEWAMCDILAFKLAGVYKNKVSPTPASFCIADRDWEALSRQFALPAWCLTEVGPTKRFGA